MIGKIQTKIKSSLRSLYISLVREIFFPQIANFLIFIKKRLKGLPYYIWRIDSFMYWTVMSVEFLLYSVQLFTVSRKITFSTKKNLMILIWFHRNYLNFWLWACLNNSPMCSHHVQICHLNTSDITHW